MLRFSRLASVSEATTPIASAQAKYSSSDGSSCSSWSDTCPSRIPAETSPITGPVGAPGAGIGTFALAEIPRFP